jgi:transposase-like protein
MEKGREFWSAHVAAAKLEAISSSEYARRHEISVSALYYWQRKLKSESPLHEVGQNVKFVELKVDHAISTSRQTACSLTWPSGMRLEISALPSPDWLNAIATTLPGVR